MKHKKYVVFGLLVLVVVIAAIVAWQQGRQMSQEIIDQGMVTQTEITDTTEYSGSGLDSQDAINTTQANNSCVEANDSTIPKDSIDEISQDKQQITSESIEEATENMVGGSGSGGEYELPLDP